MNRISALLASVIVAAPMGIAEAQSACGYPDSVGTLPNGKTATKEEMLEAQKLVKDFVSGIEAYLACIDAEVQALGEEATDAHRLIRDKRHNAAVDAMDAVAGEFNLAVREFKAREQ